MGVLVSGFPLASHWLPAGFEQAIIWDISGLLPAMFWLRAGLNWLGAGYFRLRLASPHYTILHGRA